MFSSSIVMVSVSLLWASVMNDWHNCQWCITFISGASAYIELQLVSNHTTTLIKYRFIWTAIRYYLTGLPDTVRGTATAQYCEPIRAKQ